MKGEKMKRKLEQLNLLDDFCLEIGLDKAYVEKIYILLEKYQEEGNEQIAERLQSNSPLL